MIISASRRTDIPAFYSDWFYERIKGGSVLKQNPMNTNQISRVDLSPDKVDGIVFWTKNPLPMIERLNELSAYQYYFQFTLNAYQSDVEVNLPSKNDVLIPAFQKLSDILGSERVIWRYDPIFLSKKYTIDYHISYFEKIAQRLKGYTKQCVISFLDMYGNVKQNVQDLRVIWTANEDKHTLARAFSEIADAHSMKLCTCAEGIDFSQYGISHARCIDDKILGLDAGVKKGKSLRKWCGCVESVDIGLYNTCMNGCKYCYATTSETFARLNYVKRNVHSEILIPQ